MAPRARSHCTWPSSATCPPCMWHPLHGPPLVCTPVPPVLPACTQKGMWAWWGTQMEGEEVRPGWRGPPRTGRGEGRRNLGDGGGIAQAEGQMEGWVCIVPPVPPPASEQRVG